MNIGATISTGGGRNAGKICRERRKENDEMRLCGTEPFLYHSVKILLRWIADHPEG
jgi:hypothetical protein